MILELLLLRELRNTSFRIDNQVYGVASHEVICDENNNPPSIQAQGKLRVAVTVRYLNTIYDVEVFNRALDVAA